MRDMQSLVTNVPSGRFGWWLRFTAPPGAQQYDKASTHQERERLRRASLTSFTAPFVFFSPLLLIQQANDAGTMAAIVVLMATSLVALFFNRLGQQVLAALLLVLAMDATIEGALLTAPGGLGSGWLLSFDLFVIPLITVGVLLDRRFLWAFMCIHIACILGDFYLLPHGADLVALIAKWHGPTIAFARPLIIQIGGCLLSFIEVKSTDQAIQKAERAQLVAALQASIAEEKKQLEEGIQELVVILSNAANGKYTTSAQLPRDSALWRIGNAIETLFARLQSGRQTEQATQQLLREIQILTALIRAARAGQPVQWPATNNGSILDPLVREIKVLFAGTAQTTFLEESISPLQRRIPPGHP